MELIKVINARKVINGLADQESIGAHLAYWMTKFVVKTESEDAFYISEMRKLIDKYSAPSDDADGGVTIAHEQIKDFNDAVHALNMTDVDDPCIRFNLSELSSELKLSMKQMYPLLDFINEDK